MPEHTVAVTDAATGGLTGLNGLCQLRLSHFTGFLHCVVPHFMFELFGYDTKVKKFQS